ncbi:hypothetical protein ONE63_005751 [Megalurothrips usitatus]|uniref:Protein MIS12 homolog n=1 Tax=Megalurothrips usitatus TaxID=439358 RepID=A0AAV7XZ23_9NEOP|nr:hypothetical protein ONE63_005751 [Megalurothrips usitatus]
MANFNCVPSREEEYETQLYGFSCNDLLGKVEEDVQTHIRKSSNQMMKSMLKLSPNTDKQEVERAINAWVNECCLTVKNPMEKLKEQLAGFFSLPQHILAPKDKRQRESYSQKDEENLRETINEQKSRIRQAKFLQSLFENELTRISQEEQNVQLLEKVLGEVKFLEGVNADVEQFAKSSRKIHQAVLGLEVKEASLKLSDRPGCAESEETLEEAIYEAYKD